MAENRVDGLLVSSVLQYLPEPYAFLKAMCALPFDYLVLDRTMFRAGSGERICVQNVPESIYEASYPCRMLDYLRVTSLISRKFTILDAVDSAIDRNGDGYFYKGIIACRK